MENQQANNHKLTGLYEDPNRVALAAQHVKTGYSSYLLERHLPFTVRYPYLMAGGLSGENCWSIYISVIRQQMSGLLSWILDYLAALAIPFAIPVDECAHNIILDGRAGFSYTGKVLHIYLPADQPAYDIAAEILTRTSGIKGPAIPSAVLLSGSIYVSYGIFPEPLLFNGSRHFSPAGIFSAEDWLLERLGETGTGWPFGVFKKLKKRRQGRLLNHKYVPTGVLKRDAKGNVLKCVQLFPLNHLRLCVAKQGLMFQCHDEAGRDIRDRLQWQYQIHRLLAPECILPQAYEIFRKDDNAYLVLQHIEGLTLNEKLAATQQGVMWPSLRADIRREIISCLKKTVTVVGTFHKYGIVHRDVTPGNFLVTQTGEVIAIDIELCCDIRTGEPAPAFILGTPGYMSPRQLDQRPPSFGDDIYALGALLLKAFTGLSPKKFDTGDRAWLHQNLYYHLCSGSLTDLICDCLNADEDRRPSLQTILRALDVYDALLLTGDACERDAVPSAVTRQGLAGITQRALNALGNPVMLEQDGRWGAKHDGKGNLTANELVLHGWHPGLYSGTAGTLLCLVQAGGLGYDLSGLRGTIDRHVVLLEMAVENPETVGAGLWHGTYGIAMALLVMKGAGHWNAEAARLGLMQRLLMPAATDLSLCTGLTGQGMALITCYSVLSGEVEKQLSGIVAFLLREQEPDGSWQTEGTPGYRSDFKINGFASGVSGILYFLLTYRLRFDAHRLDDSIIRGLRYLSSQYRQVDGKQMWLANNNGQVGDPWLENGAAGIALTFIKAFEVYGEPGYKTIAGTALSVYPKSLSANAVDSADGMSGLGEVYLEAYRVFGEEEWAERARHIADFLVHCFNTNADGSVYWLHHHFSKPAAGYLSGNCGIIHFLMRVVHPGRLGFPFPLINNNDRHE
ncbi:lanthionine synthetase LanC family protein [Mucilaginibacter celer]|uniref:Protein kinase domain-containing protein n=1 Tax=Mucilaginibacter celer TaxID=2305508 RepID=A0A494VL27_9SPHI|nr:lanthionine synthetase LanC family protein [Mucilaginibacter celer]AYL94211.1 hypothetical protein HYN43_002390 [Mucilaginibacter celer]